MLFYVTMGYKLRRFARLAERVYKVIIGLWLRLKYKWLGYDVLGLYKRRTHYNVHIDKLITGMFGDYTIQLTPTLCIFPNGCAPKFEEQQELFTIRVL